MKNTTKHLLQEYEEAFHTPEGQVKLITESQATFLRAVMRCNDINETSRTLHEQERLKEQLRTFWNTPS